MDKIEYVVYIPKYQEPSVYITEGESYRYVSCWLNQSGVLIYEIYLDKNQVATINISASEFISIEEQRVRTIQNIIND